MHLQKKTIKEFSKIDKPYTVSYRSGKATSIETIGKEVKLFSTSSGACMKVNGTEIQLATLESINHLLKKFNLISKSSKVGKVNQKEDLCDLLSDSKKQFTAEYFKGELLALNLPDNNLNIKKTSSGYCIKMGKGLIGADDLESIKKLLIKMDIITPQIQTKGKKKSTNNELEHHPGVEQLTLDI